VRPPRFLPRPLADDERYVVDDTTGQVWHRVLHRPLYVDVDRSGTVYHAHHLRYFELGRATLMRDRGVPYSGIEASGFLYPVTDTRLTYYGPLGYDEPFWIHTRPARLERVRVRFEYVLVHADTGADVSRGYTVHCAVDAARRVTAVDARTAELVEEWEAWTKSLASRSLP